MLKAMEGPPNMNLQNDGGLLIKKGETISNQTLEPNILE